MEVLLLFTIFLDIHLAVGWVQNILEPGRAPKPPEEPLNPLIPPEKKFSSMIRRPQGYPLVPKQGSPQREWPFDSAESSDDYWEIEPPPPLAQRKPLSCLTTGLVSSGITIVSILAIVTVLLKILPYLFMTDWSLKFQLSDFIHSAAKSLLPASMRVIPDIIHPKNTWTPKRPYSTPEYYPSADQGRYSPYRKVENDDDYKK